MRHNSFILLEALIALAKQIEFLSEDLIRLIAELLDRAGQIDCADEFAYRHRDVYEGAIAALKRMLETNHELTELVNKLRQAGEMLDEAPAPGEDGQDVPESLDPDELFETTESAAYLAEEPFIDDPEPEPPEPEPRPKASSGGSWCPVCGAPVSAGFAFCTSCGSPVGRPNAAPGGAFPRPPAQMSAPPTSAAPKPPAETNVTLSKVRFSAVAPRRLVKGDYSILHMVMYEEQYRKVVDEILRESEAPMQETRGGTLKVREDTAVRVVLRSPDIEIEDNTREQLWAGDYLSFTFPILLPEDYKKRQVLFFADVYLNDLIATRLSFTANCVSLFEQKLKITRSDVLSAFVSYASQDRARVASIIQGMQKARPDMDVFFDVETLRSGDDWEQALRREIDSRDMLYLCWSRNARDSIWVDAEWRFALDRKGIDCIEPIPLDPPDVCPPPEELKKKHFNDRLLYIIKAEMP